MKKKDLEQLKSKQAEELNKDLADLKDKLWKLSVDLKSGKVKNVREVRKIKKTIAVINLLLNRK